MKRAAMDLAPDEIHVWPMTASAVDRWVDSSVLAVPDRERARADRIRSTHARRRYLRERVLIREIVSRYLGVEPAAVELARDSRGKPRLDDIHRSDLEFNLSDSAGLAWIAVGRCGPLGLDIERLRSGVRVEDAIRRFFAPREIPALLSLPRAEREAAFFRTWVRKEAYLKAIGGGVPARLDRFVVSVAPDESPAILETELEPGGRSAFSLYDLAPPAGYAAALAAQGGGRRLRHIRPYLYTRA